jgi:hypothetical protein
VPPLSSFVKVRIKQTPAGEWACLALPKDLRALVLVNLGSYGTHRLIVWVGGWVSRQWCWLIVWVPGWIAGSGQGHCVLVDC